jgi:uncharacterized protein
MKRICSIVVVVPLLLLSAPNEKVTRLESDVVIIGAGVGGLSAALEAGRGGARVTVIDMASVFGGHAVLSGGGLSIVDTPTQRASKIQDSPELAAADFRRWGGDPDPFWVDYYVRNSKAEIYDWLTAMGVKFTGAFRQPGNSVPRFHVNPQRGFGVVRPIYRECLLLPNIRFVWNTKARSLDREEGRIAGVTGVNVRTGEVTEFRAPVTVLATGGFLSNLEMVRAHWSPTTRAPKKILLGSGINSTGSGHKLATDAGGVLFGMDRQWNYPYGLPDPRFEDGSRGLNSRAVSGIWVNQQGKRFLNENGAANYGVDHVLQQPGGSYWSVYDDDGSKFVSVAGTEWDRKRVQHEILENEKLVKSAATLKELAGKMGVPAATLEATVARWNELVEKGKDEDYKRFGYPPSNDEWPSFLKPSKIVKPPFHAIQMYVMTRKSLGGVKVDRACRVVDRTGKPIDGLYAVGEVSGFGGINGKAGLEGTFLGPAIVQGRMVGRMLAKQVSRGNPEPGIAVSTATQVSGPVAGECQKCHNLPSMVSQNREGYWHFGRVHTLVMERKFDCAMCHSELTPFKAASHKIDRMAQIQNCIACHLATNE